MDENMLLSIISDIDAEYQGRPFKVFHGNHHGRLWVQVGTERPCTETGKFNIGKGLVPKVAFW